MKNQNRSMILSAFFLALCLLLPFVFGQLPGVLKMLSPMHVPVFLCGFVCGMPWAIIVGFAAPLLRSLMFSVPVLFPTAISMAFELAAYGTVSAVLYRKLPEKPVYVYVTLVLAMLAGRAVMGIVNPLLFGIGGSSYSFAMFISAAFVNAVPGILFHILVIPPIVIALKRANLIRA